MIGQFLQITAYGYDQYKRSLRPMAIKDWEYEMLINHIGFIFYAQI